MEPMKATSVNSRAEELFVQLFCEAFGPEKTENLQVQYPCVDIYGRHRYIDFALESPESKIAIEIDGETYHNPSKVSENKYADDLLKQNSLIYDNWKVSVFYILSVDLHSLKTLDVPADIEWAMLVAYHRGRMEAARGTKFFQKYQELDKDYDMVIGSIANDRMFYVLDSFFEGTITDTALVKSLSALKLGRQYVAITQKACDAVKIEREVQLLWMERQALKKASEQNRSNGIAFANQICKEYRREGRFFDEILDGAKQRR